MFNNKVGNQYTNVIVSGSVALGVIAAAGSMLVAPSTLASTFSPTTCYSEPELPIGDILCGDKSFTNFDLDPSGFFPAGDANSEITDFTIEINPSGNWEVLMSIAPTLGSQSEDLTFELSYDVQITDDFPDYFFENAGLDSDVDVINSVDEIVIKEIFNSDGDLVRTLTSTDGVPDGPMSIPGDLRFISVLDTVSVPAGGSLDQFENDFSQTSGVPEPTTVLGLLAVGGLGLLTKRKKQA